jgi:cation transport regulator ChaC
VSADVPPVFAYGSLMSLAELRTTCPGAEPLGRARLSGYRLAFTRLSRRWGAGVADVVADDGAEVWGVLHRVPAAEMPALRAREGAGVGAYREVAVRVEHAGGLTAAVTFAVVRKEPGPIPPRRDYLDLMVAAAREHRLPARYVSALLAIPPARS